MVIDRVLIIDEDDDADGKPDFGTRGIASWDEVYRRPQSSGDMPLAVSLNALLQ
ncbi:hypothetical protein Tco_0429296, partial [Tanacetum coccineum]